VSGRRETATRYVAIGSLWLALAGQGWAQTYWNARDYAAADAHAASATSDLEKSPAALGKYLGHDFTDPRDKLRAIYRWMALQMNYDVESYRSGRQNTQTAQQALAAGVGSCDGFSTLYAELAKHAGVDVVTVLGYAKDGMHQNGEYFKDTNHAWNAVKLDNEWHLIDATWGAGFDDGRQFVRSFNPFYFLAPAAALQLSHFAKNPSQRFDHPSKNAAQFSSLPFAPVTLLAVARPSPEDVEHASTDGFVKTFAEPSGKMQVEKGPFAYTLRAGRAYEWRIQSLHYDEIAMINNGVWTYFKSDAAHSYSASMAPLNGLVQIAAKNAKDALFTIVLEYAAK
jgi:Transglutaminase-like superfamily